MVLISAAHHTVHATHSQLSSSKVKYLQEQSSNSTRTSQESANLHIASRAGELGWGRAVGASAGGSSSARGRNGDASAGGGDGRVGSAGGWVGRDGGSGAAGGGGGVGADGDGLGDGYDGAGFVATELWVVLVYMLKIVWGRGRERKRTYRERQQWQRKQQRQQRRTSL